MITFFFRKKSLNAYSIEELFTTIISHLPASIQYLIQEVPEAGAGMKVLIRNGLFARRQQSRLNHITGDVYYLVFFLPAKNTIITFHDLRPLYRGGVLKRFLLKQLWFKGPALRAEYITVISEATRRDLLMHVPGIEAKIRVIYNCLSPRFVYTPKEFNAELPRILHIGTKENKNLDRLIEAISGIDCHLRIIGPLNHNQTGLMEQHGIKYSFAANLSTEEILEEYRLSDMLCFISLQEGFGMPVIEAQATGRPVITSTVSSLPEVAGAGAILVNPHQVEEIRLAVRQLLDNRDLRESLIAKGLKNIERFRPEVIAAQYARLYEQILSANE